MVRNRGPGLGGPNPVGGEDAAAEQLDRFEDVDAKVGDLIFRPDFSNPDVNVDHERDRSDHSIVSGPATIGSESEFVVQAQGRRPSNIEIVGWITENQLNVADELVSETFVDVRTDRWVGTAVPTEVRTGYNRTIHERYGPIFEVTITMKSVSNELISG